MRVSSSDRRQCGVCSECIEISESVVCSEWRCECPEYGVLEVGEISASVFSDSVVSVNEVSIKCWYCGMW